jgi:hypothetical protein
MEEFKKRFDDWENLGRNAIENACTHKEHSSDTNMCDSGSCDECGHSEDSAIPMMNFGYPLEMTPNDKKVLEVVKETCCTVMHNTDTDEYFIALCGGGMDLSQDIALAYVILENWIPFDLAEVVSTQKGLSQGGKNWERLKVAMKESLSTYISRAGLKLQTWSA